MSAKTRKKYKKKKKRRLPRFITLLIVLVLLTVGYARYIEPHRITTEKELIYTGIIDDSSGIKIALFADTHFSKYYTPEDFQKAVKKINQANPDIVFFLGDLVDDYENYDGDINKIIDELASIKANVGKFAVYGNHDYGGNMEFEYPGIMEAGGFQLLINEYQILEDKKIGILGVDDILIGYGDPYCAAGMRSDLYNIVICHEPDIIDEMLPYDIDMMFSGHTHGRQIGISLFDSYTLPAYGQKYIHRLYEMENARGSKLYVTSGLGTTKLPMRFATPPEVNFITIK